MHAVNTLHKLVSRYGIGIGVVLALGGGTAVLTIPDRLAKVERDHVTILRHQARQEAGQDYILCVISERAKEVAGDVRECESLKPRRRPSTLDDDETGP